MEEGNGSTETGGAGVEFPIQMFWMLMHDRYIEMKEEEAYPTQLRQIAHPNSTAVRGRGRGVRKEEEIWAGCAEWGPVWRTNCKQVEDIQLSWCWRREVDQEG